MAEKWTAGPWYATPFGKGSRAWNITATPGNVQGDVINLATALGGLGARTEEQTKANAYLASSAPDLYRELEHLVLLIEPHERDGSLNIPGLATLNGARAALAKARGDQ